MTRLRQMMLEELERRNYAPGTIRSYVRVVAEFARHFHRSPHQLGTEHIRQYQAYLFRERKLNPKTVTQHVAALRFFFVNPRLPSNGCIKSAPVEAVALVRRLTRWRASDTALAFFETHWLQDGGRS